MKIITITLLLITSANLQFNFTEFPIPPKNFLKLPPTKSSLQSQLGPLYQKLSNKQDVIQQKTLPFQKSTSQIKAFSGCKIRTGKKRTHWAWNGNHSFVKGSGSRAVWYYVPFSPSFPVGTPKVEVALYGLDTSKGSNLRVTGAVVWKSRFGFVLKISTWADSKVYFAGYSYTAHYGCE